MYASPMLRSAHPTDTVSKCAAPQLSVSISSATNRITTPGFAYDNAGDLTNENGPTYTWNAEEQITVAGGVTYTYDGDGLRVKKSNGKLYWRSIGIDVLAETDLAGNNPVEFIYFAGERVAARHYAGGGQDYYIFSDHLGSARVITSATGAVCGDADYLPFGAERATYSCWVNYKFATYERDPETGLDYAIFRYYNSRLGRFMSPDLIAGGIDTPQSLNLYAYVLNDPVNLVDPLGLDPCPPGYRRRLDPASGNPCVPYTPGNPNDRDERVENDVNGPGSGTGCWLIMGSFATYFSACPVGALGRTTRVNECAANSATSVTEVLGIEPNSLTDILITGNNASALSNVTTNPGQIFEAFKETASFLGLFVNGPQPQSLVNLTANVVSQVPTNTYVTTTENLGKSVGTVTRTAEQTVGQTAIGTVARTVGAVFTLKFALFDVPAYLNALYDCARQVE